MCLERSVLALSSEAVVVPASALVLVRIPSKTTKLVEILTSWVIRGSETVLRHGQDENEQQDEEQKMVE